MKNKTYALALAVMFGTLGGAARRRSSARDLSYAGKIVPLEDVPDEAYVLAGRKKPLSVV